MNWNDRVSKLRTETTNYLQSLQYTAIDAYRDGLTIGEYTSMLYKDFLDQSEEIYDNNDLTFISDVISGTVIYAYKNLLV
jgi:hypothetical protein